MPRISSLFIIYLVTFPLLAQVTPSPADLQGRIDYQSILDYQLDYLKKYYFQNVDNIDELVNGKEYIPYYFKSDYKPLLYFDRKHKSSITLKGRRYENVMLEYDTFRDELTYGDSLKLIDYKVFRISLNKDPVDGFSFYFENDSLSFRYFSRGKDMNFNLPEGFYELGYDGKCKLIIKHRSYCLIKEGKEEYIYTPVDYINIDGEYRKLPTNREFFRLFGDKSGEIKKFIRTNKVRLHKPDKHKIVSVLKYYESLISGNR